MRDEEAEIGGRKSEVSIRNRPLSGNSCRPRVSARTNVRSSCSSLAESRRRLLRTKLTQTNTLRTTRAMNATCLQITPYVIAARRAPPAAKCEAVRKTGIAVPSTQYRVLSTRYQVFSTQCSVLSTQYSVGKAKDRIPFSSNPACFVRNHPASMHQPFHQGAAGAGVGAGPKSLCVNRLQRRSTWCIRTEGTEGRCRKRAGKSIGS